MTKRTRRTGRNGQQVVEATCTDCGQRVFGATDSDLLFHGCGR